ncbi:hypothetical protein DFH07DRAFT_766667 [Mycena maculata]|uniref:Uncharacterized protein n=1 Tax=Mycena maculata TaxID=230809 RepID=A0AAD7K2T1_9AGAR|nr:hypothetical protein DFH07DRAFT_766667 [Mycena maculata]
MPTPGAPNESKGKGRVPLTRAMAIGDMEQKQVPAQVPTQTLIRSTNHDENEDPNLNSGKQDVRINKSKTAAVDGRYATRAHHTNPPNARARGTIAKPPRAQAGASPQANNSDHLVKETQPVDRLSGDESVDAAYAPTETATEPATEPDVLIQQKHKDIQWLENRYILDAVGVSVGPGKGLQFTLSTTSVDGPGSRAYRARTGAAWGPESRRAMRAEYELLKTRRQAMHATKDVFGADPQNWPEIECASDASTVLETVVGPPDAALPAATTPDAERVGAASPQPHPLKRAREEEDEGGNERREAQRRGIVYGQHAAAQSQSANALQRQRTSRTIAGPPKPAPLRRSAAMWLDETSGGSAQAQIGAADGFQQITGATTSWSSGRAARTAEWVASMRRESWKE